jgi:hypothetical protein
MPEAAAIHRPQPTTAAHSNGHRSGRSLGGGSEPAAPVAGRAWLGLRRVPWLTATVFAVTTAGGVAQQLVPGLMAAVLVSVIRTRR